MPKPMDIFDIQLDRGDVYPGDTAIPLTVGYGWEPGDMRVVICHYNYHDGSAVAIGATPSPWTRVVNVFEAPERSVAFVRTFPTSGTVSDTSVSMDSGIGTTVAFTVHGQLQGGTPTIARQRLANTGSGVAPSVATGLGELVDIFIRLYYEQDRAYIDLTDPSQMRRIGYFFHNMADNRAGGLDSAVDVTVLRESRTSGTSGTRTQTDTYTGGSWANWAIFVPAQPDVVGSISKATEADTGRAVTSSLMNLTTWSLGKAVEEKDVARQLWQPLNGMRLSNPIEIPEGRLLGSRILYRATVPAGSTLTIETSVDHGATWQLARHNSPIARLERGIEGVKSLMTRVTMTRESLSVPSPRLHRLETIVGIDTSVDEYKPIGVFLINDTNISDTNQGVKLTISGIDLSYKVGRNRWDDIFTMRSNRNYGEVIRTIISNRMPGVKFNFQSTPHKAGRIVLGADNTDGDPWADAQRLADSIGMELFFDPSGICTLRQELNPDVSEAVWEFSDRSKPTITELNRGISNAEVYNRVVVIGDGTFTPEPIRIVKQDDDPASATYVKGRYGVVTKIVRDTAVITYRQARDMATAMIRRVKGLVEAVEIQAVPNPALEPGDIVRVTRGPSKVEGQFIIDSMSIPLSSSMTMRAAARRQRLG